MGGEPLYMGESLITVEAETEAEAFALVKSEVPTLYIVEAI